MARKRRTRQHIIEDLSANHVELSALKCGFSVERISHDYGVDLNIYTYDTNGEVENGLIMVQLKATDALQVLADRRTISFTIEKAHLESWLDEPSPVFLIVFDAQTSVAYWLYVQAHFEGMPNFDINTVGNTHAVHIPMAQVVNEAALAQFADYKTRVLRQAQGVIRHAN